MYFHCLHGFCPFPNRAKHQALLEKTSHYQRSHVTNDSPLVQLDGLLGLWWGNPHDSPFFAALNCCFEFWRIFCFENFEKITCFGHSLGAVLVVGHWQMFAWVMLAQNVGILVAQAHRHDLEPRLGPFRSHRSIAPPCPRWPKNKMVMFYWYLGNFGKVLVKLGTVKFW